MMFYTDIELIIGCVHIGWDTTAEEVTLEFSDGDGKEIEAVTLTTDYFQLPFDADWLKGVDGDDKITATVSKSTYNYIIYTLIIYVHNIHVWYIP